MSEGNLAIIEILAIVASFFGLILVLLVYCMGVA